MRFKLYINYLSEPYKRVWILETSRKKYKLTHVSIYVTIYTMFEGKDSKQPKAYLIGNGRIKVKGRKAVIYE